MSVLDADPLIARRSDIRRAARSSLRRRRVVSATVAWACGAALLVAIVPLVIVIGYTVHRGFSAWSADFFTNLPTPAGIPGGGISNAIVGSLIINGIAGLIGIPIGILVGFYLARTQTRFAGALRYSAEVFTGIPSIAIGIFAYAFIVVPLGHFSAISASIALAILMVPVVARATEVSVRTVPAELVEAGMALGGHEGTVARKVTFPVALPGILTGALLAMSRALGESAPLLFTAIGSQSFSTSLTKPIAALPLVVYIDGLQPYPDLQRIAWGTALFLVMAALLLNVASRIAAGRLRSRSR
jgi:phosphate transport system permease protein